MVDIIENEKNLKLENEKKKITEDNKDIVTFDNFESKYDLYMKKDLPQEKPPAEILPAEKPLYLREFTDSELYVEKMKNEAIEKNRIGRIKRPKNPKALRMLILKVKQLF
jgi:hypothetical protein